VAPLSTFPPSVRALAEATPFPSMLAFPAALLAGEPVNVAAGFAGIGAWCALLLPIALLLWRAGIRRYAALGA
jgi:ABC-2 type transport system permease protein